MSVKLNGPQLVMLTISKMPICHFTEELCGVETLRFYHDIESVIITLGLWHAMASPSYRQLDDFIFEHCARKDEYSGALFDYILVQFHLIARDGWDTWIAIISGKG